MILAEEVEVLLGLLFLLVKGKGWLWWVWRESEREEEVTGGGEEGEREEEEEEGGGNEEETSFPSLSWRQKAQIPEGLVLRGWWMHCIPSLLTWLLWHALVTLVTGSILSKQRLLMMEGWDSLVRRRKEGREWEIVCVELREENGTGNWLSEEWRERYVG